MSGTWRFFPVREFAARHAGWQQLNLEGPGSPLLRPEFVQPLIDEFAGGDELLAVHAGDGPPSAMAILCKTGPAAWHTFQPAQAPLGLWLQRPEESLADLLTSLLPALPGFAQLVGVMQQDPELLPRPADSALVQSLDYVQTARVTLSEGFDAYWAARGRNLRNNLKKQRTRLERSGAAPHVDTLVEPAEVERAVEDYAALESAGWKASGGTAVLADSDQGRFYRSVLANFAGCGECRVYRLRYADQVAAMDLCVGSGDILVVLKTAYNEALGDSSPASLLRQTYFRDLFEEGRFKRIEFYGRLMEWHTRWTDEVRTLYHVNCYRWSWLAEFQDVARALARRSGLTPVIESKSSVRSAAGAEGPAADAEVSAAHAERSAAHAERAAPAPHGAHVATVHDSLAALSGPVEQLFARAGRSCLFHTAQWYRTFVEVLFEPSERLRLFVIAAEARRDNPQAALVLRPQRRRLLSSGTRRLAGVSNYYSSLFGPVIDPEVSDLKGVLDALVSAIRDDGRGWDVVDLRPLDADSPVFRGLVAAFKSAQWHVQSYFCFGNWYLKVGGRSYDQYAASLPAALRNTLRRKARQLDKAGNWRMVVYRDASGLDEGLSAYDEVYGWSWKTAEPYPDFIEHLCRTCAEAGWLRLGVLYIGDRPAAAQIWFVNGRIATIYKLAYDERFAKFSPGSILTAHLMQQAIDLDKVEEVDYLTGDDPYKRDWMSDRRERWGIIAFNLHTTRGLIAAFRHAAMRSAKRMLESARANRGVRWAGEFLPRHRPQAARGAR